jgi:integrase
MASSYFDSSGSCNIEIVMEAGFRRRIRLGKVSRRAGDSFKLRVEALHSAKILGNAPDRDTSLWLAALSDSLYRKLVAIGLVESREPKAVATLAQFIDDFIAGRTDKKSTTLAHYQRGRRYLVEYFGENTQLAAITPHAADQFRSWLLGSKKQAENTVRGHIKNAKLFFGAAIRARLITENPFKGMSSQLVKRPDRMAFIERRVIHKVLDACPTSRWRAIVVLCRFGGLRCPSEVLALRWSDISFETGRFKVRSPKGEGFGKGVREVPLFPEVREVLELLRNVPSTDEFVISSNNRSSDKNLRSGLLKILEKAGVTPWERLFQNLRSSRETELVNEFSIHVVTNWLGNTLEVAVDHYMQVRGADFEKAAQIPAQYVSVTPCTAAEAIAAENEKPLVSKESPTKQGVFEDRQAPRAGPPSVQKRPKATLHKSRLPHGSRRLRSSAEGRETA